MKAINLKSLKPFLPWIIVGVVVRLILSAVSLHPDIWALSLTPHFFAYDGVINIYDHLAHLTPQTSDYARTLGTQDVFIYPPLAYYTLGIFMLILKPFYNADFFNVVAANLSHTAGDPRLFSYLVLAKLPYLVFDLASLYFICQLVREHKQRMVIFFLWLYNPVSLHASYMVGNFDIIPTFFTILGTYYFAKDQTNKGFLAFGIGAAYKTYPVLIALPLIFFYGKTFMQKIKYGVALVGPYLITCLPFITTEGFRGNVLFNQKNTKFLFMGLPVSGAEVIYVFIVGVVLICLAASYKKVTKEHFWVYPLAVLLLFFSVTHYHPQWMLWLSPFVILVATLYRSLRWPIVLMFGCYVGIVLLFEASLSTQLFSPLNPSLQQLPGLVDIIAPRFDVFELKSLLRSVFAGISIWLMVRLMLYKQEA